MRSVRNGVFETNSSSMHSVSIMPNRPISQPVFKIGHDRKIICKFGEFGWGYSELKSQQSKLSYLLTMVLETEGVRYKTIEEFYECKGFKKIEEVLKNKCGCNGIVVNSTIDDGYIDHQSYEDYSDLSNFLSRNNVTVEDFLFNDGVRMLIDNDNRDHDEDEDEYEDWDD